MSTWDWIGIAVLTFFNLAVWRENSNARRDYLAWLAKYNDESQKRHDDFMVALRMARSEKPKHRELPS